MGVVERHNSVLVAVVEVEDIDLWLLGMNPFSIMLLIALVIVVGLSFQTNLLKLAATPVVPGALSELCELMISPTSCLESGVSA